MHNGVREVVCHAERVYDPIGWGIPVTTSRRVFLTGYRTTYVVNTTTLHRHI